MVLSSSVLISAATRDRQSAGKHLELRRRPSRVLSVLTLADRKKVRFGSKADIGTQPGNVRIVPKADIATIVKAQALLNEFPQHLNVRSLYPLYAADGGANPR